MMHTLLLEIGMEEMPSRFVKSSSEQLEEKMKLFLESKNLTFDKILSYSSPRRLAIIVDGIADEQEEKKVVLRGPSKKAGIDENGNFTKAASGFAKSKSLSLEDLYVSEVKGTEYLFAEVIEGGKKARDILKDLGKIVETMHFPVSMRWSDHSFSYLRPVHWITALLDQEVIPFTALDVTSNRVTRGHRFLGTEVELKEACEYVETLQKQFVIVDRNKRKEMIASQIDKLAKDHNWNVEKDVGLLEEVTDMVEYPTAFFGEFDPAFLSVPDVALVTTMKDHQRYFSVRDESNILLPYFIAVRNGNSEHIEIVSKGNEKVLSARLADASFFYQEDLKETIEDALKRLSRVNFYEGMGSLSDKSKRVQTIAEILAQSLGWEEEQIKQIRRAAEIAKFDLVSNMVNEFPELQGVMGEIYADLKGESSTVAQSIREQYMPLSSEGELPDSNEGALLSAAEKMDNLLMFFHAGMIPTGSNDPLALRRQAYGVIRIFQKQKWAINLHTLIQTLGDAILPDSPQHLEELEEFFLNRLDKILSEKQYRYDIIDAVLSGAEKEILALEQTAEVLQNHSNDLDFKEVVESLTRVSNLAEKAPADLGLETVKPDILHTDSEKELYTLLLDLSKDFSIHKEKEQQYEILRSLHSPIDKFFDENMVMEKDETIKENRLSLLKAINDLTITFANMKKLIVK